MEEGASNAHHETMALISEHGCSASEVAEGSPDKHKVMAMTGYYNIMHRAKQSQPFYEGAEKESIKKVSGNR